MGRCRPVSGLILEREFPAMKRFLAVGLLALPVVLLAGQEARAQHGCSNLGVGGFCFKFLGKLHQQGPLYNYGPYAGYYPFEPYGPWNSQLQYTGPYPGTGGGQYGSYGWLGGFGHAGSHGFGSGSCNAGHDRHIDHHPWGHWGRDQSACSASGSDRYARHTFLNVTGRIFPLFHKHNWNAGCGTCSAPTAYTTAAEPSPIVPTGYARRER